MASVDFGLQTQSMATFLSKLRPRTLYFTPISRICISKPFCSSSSSSEVAAIPKIKVTKNTANVSARKAKIKVSDAQIREKWLASLTYPLSHQSELNEEVVESNFVIGIDPDASGALAVLKREDSGFISAEVFDSPCLGVLVGGRVRKRLNVRATIQLLQNINAPIGTAAYIEQSTPQPLDGKQGWWSGGFNYGIWIGVLVASGYSVVPVSSASWKNEFNLSGNGSSKDDSRRLATMLFPSLDSQLKRKKDHGRAEALLIAAYGKGIKINLDALNTIEEPLDSSS